MLFVNKKLFYSAALYIASYLLNICFVYYNVCYVIHNIWLWANFFRGAQLLTDLMYFDVEKLFMKMYIIILII